MIYWDNHTATRPDAKVIEAMQEVWARANAAVQGSSPWSVLNARALEEARTKVEATLNAAKVGTVRFTRGNDDAHRMLFDALYERRIVQEGKRRVLISCREEASVMREALRLKRKGVEVVRVPLDGEGSIDKDAFAALIDGDTAWASIVSVDAQSGVIMPVDELASVCKLHGVPLHTDATCAIGKLPFDLEHIEADAVTFEGDRIYAPGHIGAMFVRESAAYLFEIWEEERVDTALAVALGKACEIVSDMIDFEAAEIRDVRDMFEEALAELEGVRMLTPARLRVPHTVAFALEGVSAEYAARKLAKAGICLQTGYDVMRRNPYQTPLIDALGEDVMLRHCVLSATLAHYNTDDDTDAVARVIDEEMLPLRYNVAT